MKKMHDPLKKGPRGSGPGSRGNVVRMGRPLNPKRPGSPTRAVKPGKSG